MHAGGCSSEIRLFGPRPQSPDDRAEERARPRSRGHAPLAQHRTRGLAVCMGTVTAVHIRLPKKRRTRPRYALSHSEDSPRNRNQQSGIKAFKDHSQPWTAGRLGKFLQRASETCMHSLVTSPITVLLVYHFHQCLVSFALGSQSLQLACQLDMRKDLLLGRGCAY